MHWLQNFQDGSAVFGTIKQDNCACAMLNCDTLCMIVNI